MTRTNIISWTFIGFGVAAMGVFQLPYTHHAQTSSPRPAAEVQAVKQSADAARANGILEGMVAVGCPQVAIDCIDRPYDVGLFIWQEQRGSAPIYVYASPRFSITLEAGSYTISSADTRGAFGLPILEPITVMISPGTVTHVDVRFEPGPELPKR